MLTQSSWHHARPKREVEARLAWAEEEFEAAVHDAKRWGGFLMVTFVPILVLSILYDLPVNAFGPAVVLSFIAGCAAFLRWEFRKQARVERCGELLVLEAALEQTPLPSDDLVVRLAALRLGYEEEQVRRRAMAGAGRIRAWLSNPMAPAEKTRIFGLMYRRPDL